MNTPRLDISSKRAGTWIVPGLFILYIGIYLSLYSLIGDSATMLSVFPVLAAGWYFGAAGGVITGLATSAINLVFLTSVAHEQASDLLRSGYITGVIMLVLVGIAGDYLKGILQTQKTVETELRAHERFFNKLSNITASTMVASDLNSGLNTLTQKLVNLFDADDCFITRWEPATRTIDLIAASSRNEQPFQNFIVEPGEANLCEVVYTANHAVPVADTSDTKQLSPRMHTSLCPLARSIVGVPLSVGGHELGAALIAYNSPHDFRENELRLIEQAGRQVALALWGVQQDAERQRHLRESKTLADISRALSETERVGLDHVLQSIVDSAKELIVGAEQAVIHLMDEEQQVLTPRAAAGFEKPEAGKMKMRLGEGVAGQVIAEGITVNIANVAVDPRFLAQATPRFRSLMVSPVQSSQGRIGTISVQSSQANAFTDEEAELLASLGTQASIAIENARLLETTQQGLKEVNALYHITQGLAASLNTEQLMQDVVNLLRENFGYYMVQIFVTDPANEELVMQSGSGKNGELAKGRSMPAGTGIVGYAAETGKPFFTNDVDQVVFYVRHPYLPETRSELAVPIKVDQRVVGVLDVQNTSAGRLTQRDLQLVDTVAEQLAVALQKASLYSDLQTSLAQEKSMRSQLIQSERLALVGRLLASVSHELNNPLQAIQNALFLLNEEKGISAQGRQDLQIVLSETERMAGMIERLRTSYRSTRVEDLQPVQINNVVEDVYALMATHLRHKNIAFEFHPEPDLPFIAGLPDQIRQVILNLLMNGVEAMPSGGRLIVSTELLDHQEVLLTVSDNGPGISLDILPHIFDAFVTSKDSGTGLGLTITYDIIHRHNGRIQAENNPEGGATFKIWFPTHAQEDLS